MLDAAIPWWGWALFAVGLLAVIMVFSALFLPDFNEPNFTTPADPAAESPDFTDLLADALNVQILRGGTARNLENGDAFYPAILGAIDAARLSVNFQCYIWESGELSERLVGALVAAAVRGVEVRVLVDAFGGFRFSADEQRRLRDAGCQLLFFRPIRWYSLVRVFRRSHQRAIVIDGAVGFLGGAAVADKWMGTAQDPEHWRDSMTMVTGPLVRGVQAAFGNDWVYCCGEVLAGPKFYPATAPDGDAAGLAVVSSPSDAAQPVRLCHWLVFRAARRSLCISNSYFIPDKRLRQAVTERARAGVDVCILVPGARTDAKPVRLAGHTHYDELLRAGVRIYEYQPTMMHAKTVVVDGIWSVVGSANMDERSMELNEENVLAVRDAGLARDIEEGIRADLARSKEIELAEWRTRPLHARVLERLARALIEQY